MKKRLQCKNCLRFYDYGIKCPECNDEKQTSLKEMIKWLKISFVGNAERNYIKQLKAITVSSVKRGAQE